MQNLTKFIVTLVAVALINSLSYATSGKENSPDLSSFVALSGQVNSYGGALKGVAVKLYQGNNLIQVIKTSRTGEFSFYLPINNNYTVEFVEDFHVTKRIAVNTTIGESSDNNYQISFVIELIDSFELMGVDISDLDFPMTIISYNKTERRFTHNPSYTANRVSLLNKLLVDAESVNSTAKK